MAQDTPKRKMKDSVFTNLFQDKKYLLQLYKTLHPEDSHATEDEIEDITIKHVLVDADYNDLGFSSNYTKTGAVRDLHRRSEKDTGYDIVVGRIFCGEKIAIDAEVRVLYQEDEKNIVGQYIIFSKVYNEQRKLHGATKKAVTETIRICKDRNVLKEYLENREQEVVDMMMTLFDDEQILKAYTKDIEENAERKLAKKKVIQMIKKGKISLDEVSEYFPELLESDIKEIETEVMRLL